jgi:hypothetical protein
MRYRLMATYRGVPYEVGLGPSNSEVVLFAACPPPEELGFEPATGHWRKPVIRAEIDTLWESRPVGVFRGEPCIVLDDPGERLHIAYLGTDADRAANLGYWQVDRGVFELLTQRDEVVGLTEERLERPLRWGEQTDETGPIASYPYGTAPWPIASTSVLQPPPDETSPAEATQVAAAPVEASLVGAAPVEPPRLETSPVKTSRVKTSPVKAAPVADASMAGALPASAPPRTVTPPAVPAPLAAPVPAENGAQPPANTWPTGVSAGMDTHPGYTPAGDALSFPAATDSQPLTVPPGFPDPAGITPAGEIGGRAARRQRVPTREIFCELADLASIPRAAYALETETDGAMCLLAGPDGFEVFIAADGARHEVRSFAEEEPAYFYLFGVLAAEAIRSGALAPAVVAANPYSGTV